MFPADVLLRDELWIRLPLPYARDIKNKILKTMSQWKIDVLLPKFNPD